MSVLNPFSKELCQFIANESWTFAKTYAETWPHEYLGKERVDEDLFIAMVNHIRSRGYVGSFYSKEITYFDEDGFVYWTMGAPVDETIIINRCKKEDSYEYKRGNGELGGSQNGSC